MSSDRRAGVVVRAMYRARDGNGGIASGESAADRRSAAAIHSLETRRPRDQSASVHASETRRPSQHTLPPPAHSSPTSARFPYQRTPPPTASTSMASRTKKRVRTKRSVKKAAARRTQRPGRGGQGFVPMDFHAEQRFENEGWEEIGESICLDRTITALTAVDTPAGGGCHMLLTDTAKAIIRRDIEAGLYRDRAQSLEPPFMPPSTNPRDYSLVRVLERFVHRTEPHAHIYCEVVFVLQRLWKAAGPLYWMQDWPMRVKHRFSKRLPPLERKDRRPNAHILLPIL